jgi:general secretion pathway protein D
VQKGWEQPVKKYGETNTTVTDAFAKDATGTARITNKLNSIIIPRIEFRDASIREAIEFLRQQAAENDPGIDGRRGVDIVLRVNTIGTRTETSSTTSTTTVVSSTSTAPGVSPEPAVIPPPAPTTVSAPSINPSDARITITLNQIPLGEALRYIASQAGLKVKIEPYAVSIIPISEMSNDLLTKQYRVPPGFIAGSLNASGSALNQPASNGKTANQPTGTAKDTQESTGGRLLVNREGAKEFLEGQGVSFSVPGSSANFLPQSSRLIVRNTPDMLELVDAIVEQANVSGPKQVEIEAKFVEITQNNLKALGFDWLLGPFNLDKNATVAGNGGSSGTGANLNPNDYPFPTNGLNQVTAGNRSGNLAIAGNAIDSLLLGTSTAQMLTPGIFGVGGLLTDPQFQVVIRALNQKKGVDLLSAPRVMTKSGQRAVIEIVREFRYPTQFQPPQIPQTVGSVRTDAGIGTIIPVGSASTVPVTPTTPTAFETRNTGVTLEVEPVVGPDGVTIDLNLVPQVVEFEGFINYGSPILSPQSSFFNTVTGGIIAAPQSVITPNVINQPIFSTRKVTTSVSVWDGQTIVLGGLMREDVQKTEDRTPIIGDIPIVGRLFRTNVDQHIKRNLIIFVTARLINPGGQPVNSTEEMEEEDLIEPPVLPEVPFYKK